MGPLVQDFKLLVSHAVDQLGMRQQQRQQAPGQRRHGAPALVAAHVVIAAAAPFALAFLALPVALLALPVALPALPATLATAVFPGGRPTRAGRLVVVAEPGRFVIEIRRRRIEIPPAVRPAGRRR